MCKASRTTIMMLESNLNLIFPVESLTMEGGADLKLTDLDSEQGPFPITEMFCCRLKLMERLIF